MRGAAPASPAASGSCPFARTVPTASPEDIGRSRQMDAAALLAEKGISKDEIAKMLRLTDEELAQLPTVAHGLDNADRARVAPPRLLLEQGFEPPAF